MRKKSLASIEIAAITNELQYLVKGKFSQVYDYGDKELLLQLHALGKGKQLLRIIPGKLLNLTDKKESPQRPTGFCMQLRKYLDNASINNFYQKDGERIVVFELEKENKFFLIIEFFSKGNIVFTDENMVIIGTLHRQIWKDRLIKPGEKYSFPESKNNWKDIDEKQLTETLKTSEKRNLATSLATELGFGGIYSEEICKRANINKDQLPAEVSAEDIKKIVTEIKVIIKLIETPKGYFYEEEITPFPLLNVESIKVTETYNEAVNTLNPLEVSSPYEKRIAEIKKMIAQQEEAIKMQEGKIEKNKQKGEIIYENYASLQKLLDAVNELKETHEWNEIEAELKKEKKIKKVNLKDKTVIIDL
ncbi:MAG: NFACT family protein [Candidatus Woesearchaeota archaeon]